MEFMKRLHDKVNIIPMVAKADTLTPDECREFKKTVSTVSAFTNYGDKGFYRITNLSNHTKKIGTLLLLLLSLIAYFLKLN